jgi:hypothetical protein
MKLSRVLFIALLFFFYMSLNAQVLVGGNLSFNSSSNNSDNNGTSPTSIKDANYNFNFLPYAGKYLSENIILGAELNISFSGSTVDANNVENITKYSTIGIAPFLRYYVVTWNKFSLFTQGQLGIDLTNSIRKSAGVTWDKPKSTRLYFKVYPGISYDINNKFSLVTTLNILSLGYSYISSKDIAGTDKTSSFNIGAGLDNIVSLGSITIGGIYKF